VSGLGFADVPTHEKLDFSAIRGMVSGVKLISTRQTHDGRTENNAKPRDSVRAVGGCRLESALRPSAGLSAKLISI